MEDKFDLPYGDSVHDVVAAMRRLVEKSKLRTLTAQRRYERNPTPTNEHGWLLVAQEFYYASRLSVDFVEACVRVMAEHMAAVTEKKGSMN
jgi:hypothetical protein